MNRQLRPISVLALASFALLGACEPRNAHDHGAASAASAPPEGLNAVQNEMRVLHEATRDWVTAVANGTLEMIPASIEKIHAARTLTEKAVANGEYKTPKNGEQLAEFVQEDDRFHAELVGLVKAASAKDLPAATRHLGTVLEGCTSCHTKYRF